MGWNTDKLKDVGFYTLDCRPYKDNPDAQWITHVFFRGESVAIFDPRGIEYNIEIPIEELNIHGWIKSC